MLLEDGVEQPVHERSALAGRIAFGQLDALVDDHAGGRGGVDQLPDGQAQQIAIDDGLAMRRPVGRQPLNPPVGRLARCSQAAVAMLRAFWRTMRSSVASSTHWRAMSASPLPWVSQRNRMLMASSRARLFRISMNRQHTKLGGPLSRTRTTRRKALPPRGQTV